MRAASSKSRSRRRRRARRSPICNPSSGRDDVRSRGHGRIRDMVSKADESRDAVAQADGGGIPSLPKALHFTPAERAARGKAARAEIPRAGHGAVEIDDDRDPVEILDDGTPLRVPELVPIRYGRMLTSPFAMYRGAAA